MRVERHVRGLAAVLASRHPRRERGVDRRLKAGRAPEARRQVDEACAAREELALDPLVEHHVRSTESVDRLLGIADYEQLSGDRHRPGEVGLERVPGGQEQEDLGLQRIGVLKLVDQDMSEPPLELAPNGLVVADEIACEEQQIEKVELARAPLQHVVRRDERTEIFAQTRGEVRVRVHEKSIERVLRRLPLGEHGLAREVLGKEAPSPLPAPPPGPGQRPQLLFQSVVVAVSDGLAASELGDEACDLRDALRAPVVLVGRSRRERPELRELSHDRVDGRPLIVDRTLPRGLEVALPDEVEAGAAQDFSRTAATAVARTPPQHAPNARRRVRDGALEPSSQGLVEEPCLLVLVDRLEQGVDARFDRVLAQQLRAETVDRSDMGFFELAERLIEARALLCLGPVAGALDLRPQPELHLPCGLLGERHGHDPRERRLAATQEGEHALHELRRLARAGGRLDDEGGVQVRADPVARGFIGEGHRRLRSAWSGASSARGFRFTRCSS